MKHLLLIFFSVAVITANAQHSPVKQLTIGDTLPALHISALVNNQIVSANTGGFKGRLLVLNFLNVTCSKLARSLTQLDSLQNEFDSRVSIMVVTVNEAETIQSMTNAMKARKFSKQSYIPLWQLPIVPNDTVLKRYFPHTMLSHVVWVDADRVIRAITGGNYVTRQHINEMLNNPYVSWPVKTN